MIITYTGRSDARIINSSDFTAAGLSSATKTWNKANGFSLDLPPDVAAFVLAQGEFIAEDGSVFGNILARNVKSFGAKGDGVTNDAAAFQSSIDNWSETLVPKGPAYRLNNGLTLKSGMRMAGEAPSGDTAVPIARLDFNMAWNGLLNSVRGLYLPAGGVGLGQGVMLERLSLRGPGLVNGFGAYSDFTDPGGGAWGFHEVGIWLGTQSYDCTLRNLVIAGFDYNLLIQDASRITIEDCTFANARTCNVCLYGQCSEIVFRRCHFRVVNETGQASSGATQLISNIWLRERSATLFPYKITFIDCTVDENARGAQPLPNASIRIGVNCRDIAIENSTVFTPVKGAGAPAGGAGYGIDVGAGCVGVSVRDTLVSPYITPNAIGAGGPDAVHVPINTIRIDATATKTHMSNVRTDANSANGGDDILDNAADTRWDNVNGVSRDRRYTTALRPTAATLGAGGRIFDTTLNKPVWSDGANYRDAAGTVV